ncbi:MAG TPA: NUDIX domain-containing protein [Polyangiaceae bacterium]
MVDPSQAEPVTAVGAVVLDGAGRVLLVRRGRPPGAGSWTLPGGHVEPGEGLRDAVVREVLEETGIAAEVVCALGVVTVAGEGHAYAIHEHLLVPAAGAADLAPHAADDAADARWVDVDAPGAFPLKADVLAVIAGARAALAARAGTRRPT